MLVYAERKTYFHSLIIAPIVQGFPLVSSFLSLWTYPPPAVGHYFPDTPKMSCRFSMFPYCLPNGLRRNILADVLLCPEQLYKLP